MNKKLRSLIAIALLVFMLIPSAIAVFANYDITDAEKQPGAGAYKYVAVIGVDGGGTFFQNTDTPNIDRIFENGSVTYEAITSTPSISAQSWGSLLHGVTPEFHGLTNAIAGSTAFDTESEYPSFFRVARENDPDALLGSFCHWKAINRGIVENNLGVTMLDGATDALVAQGAADYVKETLPKILFVQFDDADIAGHNTGYGSQEFLSAITTLDEYIGWVYDAYVDAGIIEDTLFIVTADHGGTYDVQSDGSVTGGHGGLTDEEMNIMLAITGKTVVNGTIGEAEIRDIAAIVTYALGYDNPVSWSARVPSGIFEGVVAGERPVYVPKNLNRKHITTPTPTKGERGYYENFINKKDLIAYLPLDGNATDLIGGTTTSHNKLYYPEAYFGQGATFDDGHISLDKTVSGTDDFAVSFWLNTLGVTGDPAVISNQNWISRKNPGFSVVLQGNKVIFSIGNGNYGTKNYFTLPNDYKNGWVHIALSVDRAANTVTTTIDFKDSYTQELLAYYSDGSVAGSMAGQDTTSPYTINIGQDGTGVLEYPFSGTLDDVMIFNRALDTEYIANLYNYYYCNLTPAKGESGYITNFITDKPLINYLTFDGNTNDACGNTTKQHDKITYDTGYYGKAAVLDRGYVSIANHDPGINSFTVAFYLNTKKLTGVGDPSIVSNKDWGSGANPGWIFAIAENNEGVDRFVFNAKGEANGAKYTQYPSIENLDLDNKWTHIALVIDREAATVKYVVDFEVVYTWINFPTHSLTTEFPLFIGNDASGKYSKFKGMIDEFMIFDGALDSDDIAELAKYFDKSSDYESAVAPTPSKGDVGYVGNYVDNEIMNYLPFDESVVDVTGNSTKANGTLSYTQGYFGKAVTLDKGYVSILEHDPGMESFSVSFWLRTDGTHTGKHSDPVIYGNGNWMASKTPGHLFYYQDNVLGFNVGNGDGVNRQKGTTPANCTGEWKHCLVVYDREAAQMRIIYDFDTTNSYSFNYNTAIKDVTFTSANPLNIGDDGTGTFDGSLLMDIDEFIIFEGALDNKDIANLADYYGKLGCNIEYTDREYTPTPNKIADGYVNNVFSDKKLQAYLAFDGNANIAAGTLNAALYGTPTVGNGYYGSALNFSNNGAYTKVNDFAPGKNDFTIATWVKVGSGTADPIIFANKDWTGIASGFLVYVKYHASGDIEIKFNMGNGSYRIGGGKDLVLCKLPSDYQERWMHIAVSMDRDAKKLLLFVNFEQVVSYDLEEAFDDLEFNTPLVIGQQLNGNLWVKTNAYIDEFMIFGEALNATDIAKLSTYYMSKEHKIDETEFKHNDGYHWNECSECGMKFNIEAHKRMENSTFCECGCNLVYSKLEIVGAGLNITENINVLYYVTVPEEYEAPYMVFEFNGNTYRVENYATTADGKLVFKFEGVSPQMICDNIVATLYSGDYYVTKDEYSVKTYCVNMLKKTIDPNLVRLLSALLAYGEKSQNYMDYDAGTATDGVTLSAGISNFAGISNNVKALVGTADPSVKWDSVALRYENAMGVRFKFTVTDPTDLELRISVNGRTTAYDVSELTSIGNGEYVVYFRGIMATEYNDAVSASFYRGGVQVGQSAVYSVNSYVYAKQLGSDTELAELVKATFNYGRAAKIYVGQ